MSDKSPLFVSALELLAHATELYASGNPKNNKFVILHLANAVELVLKDCLIDHGVSIYKNPKETITIWGAFDELTKLNLEAPEKPIIELLIDDRNTIQHRFGFPNSEAVFYYLEEVVSFFSRFLQEQYKVDLATALDTHLSVENLAILGLVKDNYSHFWKLMDISPEAAIQQAFATVENKIDQILFAYSSNPQSIRRFRPMSNSLILGFLDELANKQYLPKDITSRYRSLEKIRDRVSHGSVLDGETPDWKFELDTAIQILRAIEKARKDGVIAASEPDGSLRHLARLSPALALENAFYTINSEMDRIRLYPSIRSIASGSSLRGTISIILDLLVAAGLLQKGIEQKFDLLFQLRKENSTILSIDSSDWQTAITGAEQILVALNTAKRENLFRKLPMDGDQLQMSGLDQN
jgi:hypothetical protein